MLSRATRGFSSLLEQQPEGKLFAAFYGLWFDRIVPKAGGIIFGEPRAYSYLPESVKEFVAPAKLAIVMELNGLQDVTWQRLGGGILTLHGGTAGSNGPR